MGRFVSYDGTEIGYRVRGDGQPLVCLPGGPARAGEYLGDLGGLDRQRRLVIPDMRGVGLSADPADPATFRVDRLIGDVEALRADLGLECLDLLAHSAGAVLAILYAAAHPGRVRSLVLLTPALAPLGIDDTEEDFRAALARREHEPWYADALAAMERAGEGDASIETFRATRPFYYARWDAKAKEHATIGVTGRHLAARQGYFAGVTFDPPATRLALAELGAPVLLYGGAEDPTVTPAVLHEAAPVFGDATVVIQPEAGHFPWVEDPGTFAAAVGDFLATRRAHRE